MSTKILTTAIIIFLFLKFIFNNSDKSNAIFFFSDLGQLATFLIGISMMTFAIYFINFLKNDVFVITFFSLSILFLLLNYFFGLEEYGSTRRIYIFSSFSIQPSEIIKLSLILISAFIFDKFYNKKIILISILFSIYLIPVIFIQLQPDTSTAIFISSFALIAIFLSGASYKTLSGITIGIFSLLPMIFAIIIADYQLDRINSFTDNSMDPLGSSYIINLVSEAIKSGGLIGPGIINVNDSILSNVIAANSDFALALIIEQLGFLALFLIILGLIGILWSGTYISYASKNKFDYFVTLLSTYALVMQGLLHIMVNVSILPATGTTLPFISNGNNAMIINFILIGLIIGVNKKNIESDKTKL
jgi:cell division protein FtsW